MANSPVTVASLLHTLATPLTVLMSTGDILRNRVPPAIETPVHLLDDLSHQFGREVVELRTCLGERIDQHSGNRAAEQIRQLAAEWRSYEAHLSEWIGQIQQAQVHLSEPLLDRILNESLPNGLDELHHVLSRLEAIQAEDLTLS